MSDVHNGGDHDLDKLARFIKRQLSGDWAMPVDDKTKSQHVTEKSRTPLKNEDQETESLNTSGVTEPVSIDGPQDDYDKLVELIYKFETAFDAGLLYERKISQYQSKLDEMFTKYQYDESIAGLFCVMYEFQALIFKSRDDDSLVLEALTAAEEIRPLNQDFISQFAQSWHSRQVQIYEQSKKTRTKHGTNHKKWFTPKKFIFSGLVLLIVAFGIAAGPINDYYTIKNANPAMIKLAQDSGMSRKGELIFLKAKPQLVSSSQMTNDCSNAAESSNNGFVTQGCYISKTNRIYILQMPTALYDVEVTTAAYEMLHPVYENLVKAGDANKLNQSIENNYNTNSDSFLTSQLANFAETEPGARDLELFSLLGTSYSYLSPNLVSYYNPYFNNLAIDVSDNNQIQTMFQADAAQLTQLQNTITNDESLANTAYYDSTTWAAVGNAYENNYNYDIYLQDYDNAESAYNQFNTLNQQYNILVEEFNGQQFNQTAPTQSS